jgi:glutamate racemase
LSGHNGRPFAPTPQSPIGVFDSGIGGFSVLRELLAQMPEESMVYYADSARAPWGTRSPDEIKALARASTRFLLDRNAKIIVVACNTASVHTLADLRATFSFVKFVGMVPAVKPAALHTQTRRIGVLATWATANGQALKDLLSEFVNPHNVVAHVVTPEGLVEQVEQGDFDGPETQRILHDAVDPMIAKGVDTIVLGCTHYPFVEGAIRRIVGEGVELVNAAPAVARQCGRVLQELGLRNSGPAGEKRLEFFTSGDPETMQRLIPVMLGVQSSPQNFDCVGGRRE